MRAEDLEELVFERKSSTQRHFGGNKQWSGFLDTDGGWMMLHCNHRTKQPGNDDCCEGLISEKAVHLTDEEVRKFVRSLRLILVDEQSLLDGHQAVEHFFWTETCTKSYLV
jgi:hypothetical protein